MLRQLLSKRRKQDFASWRLFRSKTWLSCKAAFWYATRAMEKFDIADPYVWGFRKSRGEVDKLLEYSHRQGLVSRRFVPEDTFHASTLDR